MVYSQGRRVWTKIPLFLEIGVEIFNETFRQEWVDAGKGAPMEKI
jgi:hypothetical protein